jgi:hypothetical protein
VAPAGEHLGQRFGLRDIEALLAGNPKPHYHLQTPPVSCSALACANESFSANFYRDLFGARYPRLQASQIGPGKRVRFKGQLFSPDGSLSICRWKSFPGPVRRPERPLSNCAWGLRSYRTRLDDRCGSASTLRGP